MTTISQSQVIKTLTRFIVMVLAVTAITLPIDQYSKKMARDNYLIAEDAGDSRIYQGRRHEVVALGNDGYNLLLQWTYVRNHGASYGVMNAVSEAMRIPALVAISLFFAVLMTIAGYHSLKSGRIALAWSVAGLIGGSVGNFVDRVQQGYVTDLIALRGRMGGASFWVMPVFNVAELVIVFALILAVSQIIFDQKN